jgi:hypothetical protein
VGARNLNYLRLPATVGAPPAVLARNYSRSIG